MKEGWEYKTFKDQFSINMGKTPPRGDSSSWDKSKITTNKWVSIADISLNEGKIIFDTKEYISDKAAEKIKKVKAGSLLMSFKLTIGKMAFAGDDLFTNEAIIAIPQNEDYDLHFLYYYLLQYDWRTLTEGNEKVKGATLNKQSIGKILLPIIPIDEQRRIVSYLDSSFKLIDEIKNKALKSLTEAKALFQSALAEAMEPKEGWEEKTLGEVSENIKNINWKNESSAYKYIDLSSVDRDKSIILNTVIVNKTNAPSRAKQLVNNNDIIFATTRPLLRRVTLIEKEYDKSICSTGFCVIRPNNNIIVPKYVFYVFKDEPFYQYIEPLQNGASYPAVTDKAVKSYTFSFPKNIEVQMQIVSHLDSLSSKVRAIEEKYQKMVEECDALKQAMLRDVFE